MPKFIHLHTHSHYSLLNALPKVDALIKTAKNDGMNAIALTDSGNMYATIEFIQECTKAEIKAIIGVDFYIAARTRLDKEHRLDNKHTRIVLLAKNMDGYRNLIKLVSRSNLEGFYYKPRIDRELMEELNDGLVAILPSFNNEIFALSLESPRLLINLNPPVSPPDNPKYEFKFKGYEIVC